MQSKEKPSTSYSWLEMDDAKTCIFSKGVIALLAKQPAAELVCLFSTVTNSVAVPERCQGCCTGTILRRERSPTRSFQVDLKRTKTTQMVFDDMKALVSLGGAVVVGS